MVGRRVAVATINLPSAVLFADREDSSDSVPNFLYT